MGFKSQAFFATKLRRFRFWWRLTLVYIKHYRLHVLVSAAILSVLFYFIFKIYPTITQTNTLNIGFVGNYTIKTLPSEALKLATKTLINVDETGKPTPSLASHWTISPDGKTYVVFLKDNLKWHDNTTVSAKDISIAITDVEINALNNKAIEFKLPNPISSFLQALDTPVFKSNSFYGTNTYRIVGIDTVDAYVKKISLLPSLGSLPKVNIKFYPSQDQALLAFKIGDIKVGSFTQAQEVENWPNITVDKKIDDTQIVTVFFNNSDNLLSSKELRQALIYSVNRGELDGQIAHGPIAHTNWTYSNTVKKYEYNTGRAKELISKSNYNGQDLILSYIPSLKSVAEKIKSDWSAVGIKVQLVEANQLPKGYQAFLTVNKLSPDPDQYSLWHSSQTKTNITFYKNVKIDKLLEDARATQDEKQRQDFYADFQRFLVEDAPVSFLYFPYKYELAYKNVKNLLNKLPKD